MYLRMDVAVIHLTIGRAPGWLPEAQFFFFLLSKVALKLFFVGKLLLFRL